MDFHGVLLVNSNTLYLSSTLLILILLKFEYTSRGGPLATSTISLHSTLQNKQKSLGLINPRPSLPSHRPPHLPQSKRCP